MQIRFLNSLEQILQAEGISPASGVFRHLSWQARRAIRKFPCELCLSKSVLIAEEPTGVTALVNAMGKYDFNNMSLLELVLASKAGTFIDVGANIGPYTLVASEQETTFVASIEPHPETFAKLARNVERNARKNVACFKLAISDHDGEASLTNGRSSSLNRVIDAARSNEDCLPVRCRTLDSLCAEMNIQPDVIKIDVEGHESKVIDGFQESLGRALLLMIEGGERSEIRAAMKKQGLLGPFYFHQSESAFTRIPQRRAEDPVYLNGALLKELDGLGAGLAGKSRSS